METKMLATTTNLKEAIKLLGDATLLTSQLSDGVGFEELGTLLKIAKDLPPVLKNRNLMWPQFTNLDEAARAELVEFVKAEITFPADKSVEEFIEKALAAIIALSALFSVVS